MPMNAAANEMFDTVIGLLDGSKPYSRQERETFARDLRDLKTALTADLNEMQQQIESAADAVKAILDNWESGDLASAVNLAESWRDDVMTVFPGFDWDGEYAETELTGDDVKQPDFQALAERRAQVEMRRAFDVEQLDDGDRAYDAAVEAAERMSRAELLKAAREGQDLGTCDED